MSKKFSQSGDTLEFTAAATITGLIPVVVGQQIGMPIKSGVSGDVITMAMEGVFSVPKVSGAIIAQGESVIWDSSVSAFDDNAATPAAGDVSDACTAWEAAGAGVTEMLVKLNTGKGTVT